MYRHIRHRRCVARSELTPMLTLIPILMTMFFFIMMEMDGWMIFLVALCTMTHFYDGRP